MNKRLVFVHPDGLHQIIGHGEGLSALPVALPKFQVRGRTVQFSSLYRVTPRMALYREPIVPASYTFHEAQQ